MRNEKKPPRAHHPLRHSFSTSTVNVRKGKMQLHDEVKDERNAPPRIQEIFVRLDSIDPNLTMDDNSAQMQYQFQPRLGRVEMYYYGLVRPIFVIPIKHPVGKFKYTLVAGYRQFQLFSLAQFHMEHCRVFKIDDASDAILSSIQEADAIWAPMGGQLSDQGISRLFTSLDSVHPSGQLAKKANKKERAKSLGVPISTVYQHVKQLKVRESDFAAKRRLEKGQDVSAVSTDGTHQPNEAVLAGGVLAQPAHLATNGQELADGEGPAAQLETQVEPATSQEGTPSVTTQPDSTFHPPAVRIEVALTVREKNAYDPNQPGLLDDGELETSMVAPKAVSDTPQIQSGQ